MHTQNSTALLITLSTMMLLINVDYTAVNLALIAMARDLQTDLNSIQWVLSAYVFAWAILVIPAGEYTNRFSKNHLCLAGLSLFLLASLLASMANSSTQLILARILQGAAGALYVPAMYAMIHLYVAEQRRGFAIGMMSLGVGLGLAIGPVLGGFLLTLWGWRSIFLINLPVGCIALFIIYHYKKQEEIPAQKKPINFLSVILLSTSLMTTLYLLSHWQTSFLLSRLALIAMSIISLYAFIVQQNRLKFPLIPLTIFKNTAYSGCLFGILLEQYAFSTIIVATGLYLQKVLLLSPLSSCLVYLALTSVFGIIAVVGGTWVDRLGIRKPIISGLLLLSLGSLVFAVLSTTNSFSLLCVMLLMLGIGMGLAFSGLNAGIVKVVASESIGIASSIFVTFALLGNTFGVTLTTLIYQQVSFNKLLISLQNAGFTLAKTQIQQLMQYIANIGNKVPGLTQFNSDIQLIITQKIMVCLNQGVNYAMLANGFICLAAFFICSALIKNK